MGQRLEATGIALLGALTSIVFSVWTRIDVRDERHLKAIELLKGRNERIETWATQVVDAMTEGVFYCMLPESERKTKQVALMANLSSLIDRGRFILPNESPEVFGLDNPPAFRGFRHPVLDHPVAIYDLVSQNICSAAESKKPLETERNNLRRKFVSDVQGLLDPRDFNRRLQQIQRRLN